jgi:hypothetical protein
MKMKMKMKMETLLNLRVNCRNESKLRFERRVLKPRDVKSTLLHTHTG